ncbi:general odorant-binding protein 19d-like [Harmonia axyridis]|uniref:Odorant binding protein 14 n=1 Tax=Harmonia axyridis TaxID=115357 RepID=A0A8K1AR08_HARAX|nr:general odorant-binding protein 19d-like [Harmonia axyridis]QTE76122.1 odorant binding protein 14 [Harmonia axyridis]
MFKFMVLVAVAVVSVNGFSQELKQKFLEKLNKEGHECAAEVGASEDDVNELKDHKFPSRHEGECLIFCLHKRFNMMHDDGTINTEGAIQMMKPLKEDDPELYEKFMSIGRHCTEDVKTQDDKCKYATELVQCAVKKGREMGMDESIFE